MPAWELVDRDEVEIEEFSESDDGIVIDGHPGYSWVDRSRNVIRYDRLNLQYEVAEVEQKPAGEPDGDESQGYRAKILRKIK